VTTRPLRSGGLASLTALNQRIIFEHTAGHTTAAEEAADNVIIAAGAAETGYVDPDTLVEEADTPEVRGRFALEHPLEFNRVKEWVELNIFAGETTGMSPLIGAFIDEWDVEWRREQGLSPTDNTGRGPTLEDLTADNRFINGALWLPLTANQGLPPTFESAMTDEETGEELAVVGVANPLTGVEFITIEPDLAQLKARPQTMFEVARRGRDFIRRALAPTQGEGTPGGQRTSETTVVRTPSEGGLLRGTITTPEKGAKPQFPDYMKSLILYSDPASEGRMTGDPRQPGFVQPGPLPRITQNELVDALAGRLGSGGGGGGGGGGAARRELVFDRDHLIAQVADRWRGWMLDPNPPPEDWIGQQVDSFVREAKAFWSGQAGQLDFDTYINERLRGHARYKEIYKWKGAADSEEQFLSRFAQPIGQLGQTSEFTRSQTESSVTSGGSPTEQLQRVTRTPEVEASGGFSRRLAQTLAGIGVG
jgi:hypothetical protein